MEKKVKIIKTGKIVNVYWILANGIAYVGDNGIRIVEHGGFEWV